MIPIELDVSARIAAHRYGAPARVVFDYLLVAHRLRDWTDGDGFTRVSQRTMRELGVASRSRRRALAALDELGLVELRQEGHGAYRARLLYEPAPSRAIRPPKRQRTHQAFTNDPRVEQWIGEA